MIYGFEKSGGFVTKVYEFEHLEKIFCRIMNGIF